MSDDRTRINRLEREVAELRGLLRHMPVRARSNPTIVTPKRIASDGTNSGSSVSIDVPTETFDGLTYINGPFRVDYSGYFRNASVLARRMGSIYIEWNGSFYDQWFQDMALSTTAAVSSSGGVAASFSQCDISSVTITGGAGGDYSLITAVSMTLSTSLSSLAAQALSFSIDAPWTTA